MDRQARGRAVVNIVGGILFLCVFVFALFGAASLSSHGGGSYAFTIIIVALLPAGLGLYRLVTGIRELNNIRPEPTSSQPASPGQYPTPPGQYPTPPASPGHVPPAPATTREPSDTDVQRAVASAKRRIGIGGVWLGAGVLITIITYANASSSATGGVYVVAWGPMLIGAYRIITGLVALAKYRR